MHRSRSYRRLSNGLWAPPEKRFLLGAAAAVVRGASGGGGGSIPNVEILDVTQIAESNGIDTYTAMSGTYTGAEGADYIVGLVLGRAQSSISGSAMTHDGNAMTALDLDDGGNSFRAVAHAFGRAVNDDGTLSYTRSGGTYGSLQLIGVSLKNVDSVTVLGDSGEVDSAGPAQVAGTPTIVGSIVVTLAAIEDTSAADAELTAVNCTEQIDLAAQGFSDAADSHGFVGSYLTTDTAEVTAGCSGTFDDWWVAKQIQFGKATS